MVIYGFISDINDTFCSLSSILIALDFTNGACCCFTFKVSSIPYSPGSLPAFSARY